MSGFVFFDCVRKSIEVGNDITQFEDLTCFRIEIVVFVVVIVSVVASCGFPVKGHDLLVGAENGQLVVTVVVGKTPDIVFRCVIDVGVEPFKILFVIRITVSNHLLRKNVEKTGKTGIPRGHELILVAMRANPEQFVWEFVCHLRVVVSDDIVVELQNLKIMIQCDRIRDNRNCRRICFGLVRVGRNVGLGLRVFGFRDLGRSRFLCFLLFLFRFFRLGAAGQRKDHGCRK